MKSLNSAQMITRGQNLHSLDMWYFTKWKALIKAEVGNFYKNVF